MDYISNTPEEQKKMLATVGVEEIEELFSGIPDSIKLDRPLKINGGLSELELWGDIKSRARQNLDLEQAISFLGGGAYDHYIPSIVDHLVSRSEFYTAYTPYQAELSQGTLQSIYEYQSMISELTGMDLANASLLDGGSATGEAVAMAGRVTGRDKVLISRGVHPVYRDIARTYGEPVGLSFKEMGLSSLTTDYEQLARELDSETAAVVIQYPNFYGSLEQPDKIEGLMNDTGALLIVIANPLCLGLLKPPGKYGADIVIGEGQPLGNPLNYGGPYLGYMAINNNRRHLREMPGRLAGATSDKNGAQGFVLTLQTREQHIRRGRATSNICTNEALNALRATIYLATMGPRGVREVAYQSLQKAHYLAERIQKLSGYQVLNQGRFFHEFLVKTPLPVTQVNNRLLEHNIIGGLDVNRFGEKEGMLIAVTEKRSRDELDKFAEILGLITHD